MSDYATNDEVEQDVAARIQQGKPYVHEEDQIAALAGMLSRLLALRAELDERTRERDRLRTAAAHVCDMAECAASNPKTMKLACADCGRHPDEAHEEGCTVGRLRAALAGNEGAGE